MAIQDGNRASLFAPPPNDAPQWFLTWMRQYLIPILKEIRYVHNEFEMQTIASGATYPFTITWNAPAPNTLYNVLLTPDAGDATTVLTLTGKTTTAIVVHAAGTAPGNVYVLRVL